MQMSFRATNNICLDYIYTDKNNHIDYTYFYNLLSDINIYLGDYWYHLLYDQYFYIDIYSNFYIISVYTG